MSILFLRFFFSFSSLFFSWKVDPLGAQEKVIEIAGTLGLSVIVAVAHEVSVGESGTHMS